MIIENDKIKLELTYNEVSMIIATFEELDKKIDDILKDDLI